MLPSVEQHHRRLKRADYLTVVLQEAVLLRLSGPFGHGTSYTGDLRTITHTYAHSGTYTVCQYVRDSRRDITAISVCHDIAFTSGSGGCRALFTEEYLVYGVRISRPSPVLQFLHWSFR
jgi:hypothetical protein